MISRAAAGAKRAGVLAATAAGSATVGVGTGSAGIGGGAGAADAVVVAAGVGTLAVAGVSAPELASAAAGILSAASALAAKSAAAVDAAAGVAAVLPAFFGAGAGGSAAAAAAVLAAAALAAAASAAVVGATLAAGADSIRGANVESVGARADVGLAVLRGCALSAESAGPVGVGAFCWAAVALLAVGVGAEDAPDEPRSVHAAAATSASAATETPKINGVRDEDSPAAACTPNVVRNCMGLNGADAGPTDCAKPSLANLSSAWLTSSSGSERLLASCAADMGSASSVRIFRWRMESPAAPILL